VDRLFNINRTIETNIFHALHRHAHNITRLLRLTLHFSCSSQACPNKIPLFALPPSCTFCVRMFVVRTRKTFNRKVRTKSLEPYRFSWLYSLRLSGVFGKNSSEYLDVHVTWRATKLSHSQRPLSFLKPLAHHHALHRRSAFGTTHRQRRLDAKKMRRVADVIQNGMVWIFPSMHLDHWSSGTKK